MTICCVSVCCTFFLACQSLKILHEKAQQHGLKMISQTNPPQPPRKAHPLTLDYIMISPIGSGRSDRRRHRALSSFQDLLRISETSDLVELRMDLTSCSTTCSDRKSSSCRCAPPFLISSLAPPSQQDILVSRSPYLCKFSHRTEPCRSIDLVLAIWLPPTRHAPLMLPTPTLPRTRAPSSHIWPVSRLPSVLLLTLPSTTTSSLNTRSSVLVQARQYPMSSSELHNRVLLSMQSDGSFPPAFSLESSSSTLVFVSAMSTASQASMSPSTVLTRSTTL